MRYLASVCLLFLASCGQADEDFKGSPVNSEDTPRTSGLIGGSSSAESGVDSGGCGHSHEMAGVLWDTQKQVLKSIKSLHKTQQIRASDDDFWVQPLITDEGERQLLVRWRYFTPGLSPPLNEKAHDEEWICGFNRESGKLSECQVRR